jgi:glucan phosphoethanolaminetransferase (alkaline phosphatase superfamily)
MMRVLTALTVTLFLAAPAMADSAVPMMPWDGTMKNVVNRNVVNSTVQHQDPQAAKTMSPLELTFALSVVVGILAVALFFVANRTWQRIVTATLAVACVIVLVGSIVVYFAA